LSPETIAALVVDYGAGVSSTDLQAKYSLSKGSVLRLLGESGVKMRRRGLTEAQLEVVVGRYRAGLTIREVAAELGLPKTTVQNALERSDVEMRPAEPGGVDPTRLSSLQPRPSLSSCVRLSVAAAAADIGEE